MNKKKAVISVAIIIVLIIIIGVLYLFKNKKVERFYLDSKYYGINEFIKLDSKEFDNLKGSYVVFTYNYYCQFSIPCEDIFKEYMEENNISFISIPFDEFKNTKMHKEVKYAPSIIVVNNNKIIDYLSTDNDEDVIRYQDINEFTSWINQYIYNKNK